VIAAWSEIESYGSDNASAVMILTAAASVTGSEPH